ncbi:MAG: type II toxin-antitoxin system HicA family toxin [Methanoregula sp.]
MLVFPIKPLHERTKLEFNGWEILVKIRKVIKIIESDGWYLKRVSGDHRQYPMR